MCIRWCCKNCPNKLTKLTHRWAYERCNEYFIARSKNESITDCPNGPWGLRRAYHRHPYRGAQSCDDCKRTRRKDKKLGRAARHTNDVMLRRQSESGAIYLGELEVPETFHRNAPLVLEPEKLDVMKSNWESFSTANGHLPSPELERVWAKTFAAFKHVDLDGGIPLPPLNFASPSGPEMSEEKSDRINSAITRANPQRSQQPTRRQSKSSTQERNITQCQGGQLFVPYNPHSILRRSSSTTAERGRANQGVQFNYKFIIDPGADTEKPSLATVQEASTPITHCHQLPCSTVHMDTNKKDDSFINVKGKEETPYSDRGRIHDGSISTTRASSLQSTRTRPWDL